MKTPDEIKKGLRWCGGVQQVIKGCGGGCPYYMPEDNGCKQEDMHADALAYIQQLEAELQDTRKAVDMTNGLCDICKHQNAHENECEANDFLCYRCPADCACKTCYPNESRYEWRGVQKEE